MEYTESLRYLESLFSIERTPDKKEKQEVYNLSFMNWLMDHLDNPQNSFRVIQVAGTNGKGSTALFIERILNAHGLRTGLYSSPHFITPRERIAVNGRFISESDFGRLIGKLADIFHDRSGGIRSYFETMTAACFLYFREQNIDVAVVEAGLGGRLDATNVCEAEVAVITKIGLDHTQTLGDTEERILLEKLGIVKRDTKVVMTERTDYLTTVAESILGERDIALNTEINVSSSDTFPEPESCTIRDFPKDGDEYDIAMTMSGRHLTENLSTALMATDIFLDRRLDIAKSKMGLETAFIPGRMQRIGSEPYVVLDGAHNPQAVENLMDTVERGFKAGRYKNVHILYGAMADKDIASIMTIFRKYPAFQVCFTQIDHFRSAKIAQLRDTAGRGHEYFADAETGFDTIVKRSHVDDLVLVTGSLYLVSEILQKKGADKLWAEGFRPITLTPEGFDIV